MMNKRNFEDYSEQQAYNNNTSDIKYQFNASNDDDDIDYEELMNYFINDDEEFQSLNKKRKTQHDPSPNTIISIDQYNEHNNQEDNTHNNQIYPESNSDIPIETLLERTLEETITFPMSDQLINLNGYQTLNPSLRIHILENTYRQQIVNTHSYPIYFHPSYPTIPSHQHFVNPTRINELESHCWLNIISFIGIEQFFIHKLYLINMNACERMYKSANFWDLFFQQLWKGEGTPEQFDWKSKRMYCFVRYFKYQSQQQLNLHVQIGQIGITTQIIANPVHNDIYNQCFVTNMVEPECYHYTHEHLGLISKMNWKVTIFLKESPVYFHLILKNQIEYRFGEPIVKYNLTAFIPYQSEPIAIFGEDIVVKRGIQQLFRSLRLSEELYLTSDELDLRFSHLRFGPLMNDRYFIWFFNSVLSWIPFPIEDIYGAIDESNSLTCKVDDLTNENMAIYFALKNDINRQAASVNN